MLPLADGAASGVLLAFIQNFGPFEMMIIMGVGILLFGKRLPEVGRSLGKGIVEFKKGLRGIEDEVEDASRRPERPRADDRIDVESPKFEVPPEPRRPNGNQTTV
ncbi:MAG: Sec-independent protein translocase subunit TatA/TatB [Planctomycetia bacterium]